MVAATIQRVLRPEGYDVDVALGGLAALEQAKQTRPDLVVLDVMMPEVDGLEVCRRLRAQGSLAILFLTARGGTPDRVRGLDSGADDYLVKPFAYTELLARVRALLRRASPAGGESLRFGDLSLDVEAHEVRRGARRIELTAREFVLLEHFLRAHTGAGCPHLRGGARNPTRPPMGPSGRAPARGPGRAWIGAAVAATGWCDARAGPAPDQPGAAGGGSGHPAHTRWPSAGHHTVPLTRVKITAA